MKDRLIEEAMVEAQKANKAPWVPPPKGPVNDDAAY